MQGLDVLKEHNRPPTKIQNVGRSAMKISKLCISSISYIFLRLKISLLNTIEVAGRWSLTYDDDCIPYSLENKPGFIFFF